ncbi:uncharacterized protein [Ptychodera flava]|uniref:uncharacterized protein n=1 Tax=Ptychodera flava TaxID=63121 RepID=UPI00396A9C6A
MMATKSVVAVLILLSVTVRAQLRISGMRISSPDTVVYAPGKQQTVTFGLDVTNGGSEEVSVSGVKLYLTDDTYASATKKSAGFPFVYEPPLAVPAGDTVSTNGNSVNIMCEAEKCRSFRYLCVVVDENEDVYLCKQLSATDAGVVHCSDLAVNAFVMNMTDDITYRVGTGTDITAIVEVYNEGEVDIPANDAADTFTVKAYFTDGVDFYNERTLKTPIGGFATTPDDSSKLRQAYASDDVAENPVSLRLTADMIMPRDKCDVLTHVCMELDVTDAINDINVQNDFRCRPLGQQPDTGAGVKDCSHGNLLKANFITGLLFVIITLVTSTNIL